MDRSDSFPTSSSSMHTLRSRWWIGLMDKLLQLGQWLRSWKKSSPERDAKREELRKKRLQVRFELDTFEPRNPPSDMITSNLVLMNLVHLGFEGTIPTESEIKAFGKEIALGDSSRSPAPEKRNPNFEPFALLSASNRELLGNQSNSYGLNPFLNSEVPQYVSLDEDLLNEANPGLFGSMDWERSTIGILLWECKEEAIRISLLC
jgi:hypothetical protein